MASNSRPPHETPYLLNTPELPEELQYNYSSRNINSPNAARPNGQESFNPRTSRGHEIYLSSINTNLLTTAAHDVLKLTPSQANPGDGRGPHPEPWTSVGITETQSVIDSYPRPPLTAGLRRVKAATDSGYDSLPPNLFMTQNANMAPHSATSPLFDGGSLQAQMQQALPDQQLPGPSPSATGLKGKQLSPLNPPTEENAETYACPHCDQVQTTSSEHQKHVARHEKKHKCDIPGCTRKEGFATLNDLDRHKKGVHKVLAADDNVWKCFVAGCKTPDKVWTRQDNFRAHIVRMHDGVDIEEYVRKSDEWLESVEKPRRQHEFPASSTMHMSASSISPYDQFASMSGAVTDVYSGPHIELSHIDPLEDHARTVHDFPTSNSVPWNQLPSATVSPYATNFGHTSFPLGPGPTSHVEQMARSFSDLPNNLSYTSMTASGVQHDPLMTQPLSHHQEDFMTALRDNPAMTFRRQAHDRGVTLPDRIPYTDLPWPESNADLTSASPILDRNADHLVSHMGASTIKFVHENDDDDADDADSPDTDGPDAIDMDITAPTTDSEAPQGLSTDDLEREIEKLTKKYDNHPSLMSQISNAVSKIIRENSSSKSVTAGSRPPRKDAARSQLRSPLGASGKQYACSRPGCRAHFDRKSGLTKHEKRHYRVYFCTYDNCFKSFGTKNDMMRHESKSHSQPQVWRCWADSKSRGKNRDCAKVFTNEESFEDHRRTEHSKGKANETFKVEQDFAGAFWCGFCNKVHSNPVAGGVDGTDRINWRYQHIEQHINERYNKDKRHNMIADWYELGGRGRTKAEMKSIKSDTRRQSKGDDFDDDQDDIGDEEEVCSPDDLSPALRLANPKRPRALSTSAAHNVHLAIPSPLPFYRGVKRSNHTAMSGENRAGRDKIPRLPQQLSATDTRHSISGPTSSPMSPSALTNSSVSRMTNHNGTGYNRRMHNPAQTIVKCCHCKGPPQEMPTSGMPMNCSHCGERLCNNCQVF